MRRGSWLGLGNYADDIQPPGILAPAASVVLDVQLSSTAGLFSQNMSKHTEASSAGIFPSRTWRSLR